jgi:hypothetical protein
MCKYLKKHYAKVQQKEILEDLIIASLEIFSIREEVSVRIPTK